MPSEMREHRDEFGQVEAEQELVMTYGVFCDYSFLVVRIEGLCLLGQYKVGK